ESQSGTLPLSYRHRWERSAGPRRHPARRGTPDRTRTCNRRLRRPVLYPVELRARSLACGMPYGSRTTLGCRTVAALIVAAGAGVPNPSSITTFLFTDIEGSTRLWETEPQAMRSALARHDAIARAAVESHGGRVVKMTGDGTHAAFDDPHDAVRAALQMQFALGEPNSTNGVALKLRCGVHAGPS